MSDPVEDLVRRTFAVRAEDVAPGDGADWPEASGGPPPRRRRVGRPLLLAAALLAVVLAAAGVVALAGGDGDDDTDGDLATGGPEATAGDATVVLVTAPRDLVVALEDERNLASLETLGLEDAIQPAVADSTVARGNTDLAIVDLETLLAETPGAPRSDQLLAPLRDLDRLRADVDAAPEPRTLDNAATGQAIFDRYGEIITGVVDAHADWVLDIDDASLREGAEAFTRGLRLEDLTTRLVRTAVLTGITQQGPGAVDGGLAELLAETEANLTRLEDLTAGTPYEEAATAVADEMRTSALLDEADSVLDGLLDVAALLEASSRLEESGWPAYLDRVEEILADAG